MRVSFRCALVGAVGLAATASAAHKTVTVEQRLAILNRAVVWQPRNTPSLDARTGPRGPGFFSAGELVRCEYVGRPTTGRSPKFTCAITEKDHVKVKYGQENGEVFAEVAATRLLWLLGFAADRMYPVRVECWKCPRELVGAATNTDSPDVVELPLATIERQMPGIDIELEHRRGWEWSELDIAKGSTRAERDALKLLTVMLQHTDSKSEQQRLLCPDERCEKPVAMVNDLGLTFGRATLYNRNTVSSANLHEWARTPVWAEGTACIGNISRSYTGTLDRPRISEDGRAFLAARLNLLTDAQLHDLFSVARMDQRRGEPIDAWVAAFKQKREEIAGRRCDN